MHIMALSFLRSRIISGRLNRPFKQCKRNNGYVVLIPEIGEDCAENTLVSESGLPEFNDLTIEKCIAAISRQSIEYENGVRALERTAVSARDAFIDVLQPLERLDAPLTLTWGLAKTLYLGNSSLMPTASYLQIHERAHRARHTKFNSAPIFRAVVDEKNKLKKLNDEEQRVLDKYILEGRLNGLELDASKRDRLLYVLSEMQKEKKLFRRKIEFATNVFLSVFEDADIARELPAELRRAIAHGDADRGPWKITLQPYVYEPFMRHCPDRELRRNAWQSHVQRGSTYGRKDCETSLHVERICSLRREQAQMLGYDTYADMSMETKMAANVDAVRSLLDALLAHARPAQERELDALQSFAAERGFSDRLELWDVPYWQRKQKSTLFELNEERLREHFPLAHVTAELFRLCGELFGVRIREVTGVPTWHRDVKFYEVTDARDGRALSGFYLDALARSEHKPRVQDDAGWHIALRPRCGLIEQRPLSALIFNFPPDGRLSFAEVEALCRRFGQALLSLLAEGNYSEVAGSSNVEWDAAGAPAELLAHWLYSADTLRALSSPALPDALVDGLRAARAHMAGWEVSREVYLARYDLDMHSRRVYWRDLARELWPQHIALPLDKRDAHPLSMSRIFGEEWAAAAYCGLWARVVAADLWSAFEEAGDAGARYRHTVLGVGGGCAAGELFRRFRGRDPSPAAFLTALRLTHT